MHYTDGCIVPSGQKWPASPALSVRDFVFSGGPRVFEELT
jgi:hypothetical protein